MIVSFALIAVLALIGIRFSHFNGDYLSRESTMSVKGIFVLIVFISHFKNYVTLGEAWYDHSAALLCKFIGQLMVVMFFFYSGYGILKQIQKSRDGTYMRSFLSHRFFPVWLQFALCLLVFVIVDLAMGRFSGYTPLEIGLSFTGWTSIGNSNWFMFITFALYLLVYVSFRLFRFKDVRWNVAIMTALCLVLIAVLFFVKERHWYDTLICFPLGMWYAVYQEKIDATLRKPARYWPVTLALTAVFLALWFTDLRIRPLGIGYLVIPPFFALVLTAWTMKIKIGNRVLGFFGKHVFSIYILQRVPMMILSEKIPNIYLYFAVCFVLTVALATGFDALFGQVKARLLKKPS